MEKELHVYLSMNGVPESYIASLYETEKALYSSVQRVNTTQTHVLSTTWLVNGYRIFAHMLDGDVVELKLGYIADNLKEIRVAHNLEKMVMCNCFGKATEDWEI